MTGLHLLALLLAFSVAVHIGSVAAFVAWRGGASPAGAFAVGGSTVGGAFALYLAAVGAYH
ncbi:hypothetical protein [Streptomyces sp. bgisy100]|uniref:hypothetical protein n=1 Tax=Streptomyces sp. bgisy100 TaxID=3413783 RepID=UPI003D722EFE